MAGLFVYAPGHEQELFIAWRQVPGFAPGASAPATRQLPQLPVWAGVQVRVQVQMHVGSRGSCPLGRRARVLLLPVVGLPARLVLLQVLLQVVLLVRPGWPPGQPAQAQ